MPELSNPRHERFAQLRADGVGLGEAYELAGFVPDHAHPSRLAAREEVLARVAELRAGKADARKAEPPALIDGLLEVAKASLALGTPAGLREARLALLDAGRLRDNLRLSQQGDRAIIIYEQEKLARSAAAPRR